VKRQKYHWKRNAPRRLNRRFIVSLGFFMWNIYWGQYIMERSVGPFCELFCELFYTFGATVGGKHRDGMMHSGRRLEEIRNLSNKEKGDARQCPIPIGKRNRIRAPSKPTSPNDPSFSWYVLRTPRTSSLLVLYRIVPYPTC
jgi:hypothetical protein